MASKRAVTVSQLLRVTIRDSGKTLYRVAKDSGVSYPALHRFVVGKRSLSMPALDRLCAYLGLELRKREGDQ